MASSPGGKTSSPWERSFTWKSLIPGVGKYCKFCRDRLRRFGNHGPSLRPRTSVKKDDSRREPNLAGHDLSFMGIGVSLFEFLNFILFGKTILAVNYKSGRFWPNHPGSGVMPTMISGTFPLAKNSLGGCARSKPMPCLSIRRLDDWDPFGVLFGLL